MQPIWSLMETSRWYNRFDSSWLDFSSNDWTNIQDCDCNWWTVLSDEQLNMLQQWWQCWQWSPLFLSLLLHTISIHYSPLFHGVCMFTYALYTHDRLIVHGSHFPLTDRILTGNGTLSWLNSCLCLSTVSGTENIGGTPICKANKHSICRSQVCNETIRWQNRDVSSTRLGTPGTMFLLVFFWPILLAIIL